MQEGKTEVLGKSMMLFFIILYILELHPAVLRSDFQLCTQVHFWLGWDIIWAAWNQTQVNPMQGKSATYLPTIGYLLEILGENPGPIF